MQVPSPGQAASITWLPALPPDSLIVTLIRLLSCYLNGSVSRFGSKAVISRGWECLFGDSDVFMGSGRGRSDLPNCRHIFDARIPSLFVETLRINFITSVALLPIKTAMF